MKDADKIEAAVFRRLLAHLDIRSDVEFDFRAAAVRLV